MSAPRTVRLLALALLAAGGCGHNVVALGTQERAYYEKLRARVGENRGRLALALGQHREIEADAATMEQRDTLGAIARARLLESIHATWTAQNGSKVVKDTQKAVALFELYQLAQAQQAELAADLAERQKRRDAVLAAYDQLAALLDQVMADQQLLLAYVNQPRGVQINDSFAELLLQAQALQKQLATARNPTLAELAARGQPVLDEARRASDAGQVKAGLDALNALLKAMGGGR